MSCDKLLCYKMVLWDLFSSVHNETQQKLSLYRIFWGFNLSLFSIIHPLSSNQTQNSTIMNGPQLVLPVELVNTIKWTPTYIHPITRYCLILDLHKWHNNNKETWILKSTHFSVDCRFLTLSLSLESTSLERLGKTSRLIMAGASTGALGSTSSPFSVTPLHGFPELAEAELSPTSVSSGILPCLDSTFLFAKFSCKTREWIDMIKA